MVDPPAEESLGMLPEVDARALLPEAILRTRLLRPPYPVVGTGTLRVLRVVLRDGLTELVSGYDGYERLESPVKNR